MLYNKYKVYYHIYLSIFVVQNKLGKQPFIQASMQIDGRSDSKGKIVHKNNGKIKQK